MASKKKTAKVPAKKKPAKKSKPADLKTKPTAASVEAFIARVPNAQRRKDAETVVKLLRRATGLQPKMWGPSIIGFGAYRYNYESGREGDMCMTGFSPRASALVLYVVGGVPKTDPLWTMLGKHRLGVSCLYINKLSDVNLTVLEKIIVQSVAYMKKTYPTTA